MSDRLLLHVRQMQAAAADACRFIEHLDRDAFLENVMVQRAVGMSILMLGEAAVRLIREDPEFTVAHPEVPWNQIQGLRNRIAHGYFDVDLEIIWETVHASLPILLDKLNALDHWRPQGE